MSEFFSFLAGAGVASVCFYVGFVASTVRAKYLTESGMRAAISELKTLTEANDGKLHLKKPTTDGGSDGRKKEQGH